MTSPLRLGEPAATPVALLHWQQTGGGRYVTIEQVNDAPRYTIEPVRPTEAASTWCVLRRYDGRRFTFADAGYAISFATILERGEIG